VQSIARNKLNEFFASMCELTILDDADNSDNLRGGGGLGETSYIGETSLW